MKYTYLLIDLFTIVVPLVFSFHRRLNFYKSWYALLPAIIITGTIFIIWDSAFTYLGYWGFNPHYITGIAIGNMPLEEILFFICVPYACIFTFDCLERLMQAKIFASKIPVFNFSFASLCVVTAVYWHNRMYTFVTFLLLSILIGTACYIIKINWLLKFYLIYAVLLIPFLIVNGLLTGTGLKAPVVWYSNSALIGIRIITIPAEDIFYGMSLMNTLIYSGLKKAIR
jgi:lycopene cyclase domain-containing protein